MKWTEKQKQTIDTRGKNVLVSAAAGSGKTAVLTERILKLIIDDRVKLSEMLVVTFTEAAADEMKSRIGSALTKAAETDEFARSQLRSLGSAKIMTFHSFCLQILRKYFFAIDLDPSFGIADEKRAELLREEALDETFGNSFADKDKDARTAFTDFLRAYGSVKNELSIRNKILRTYGFIMSLPEPYQWLSSSVEALFAPVEKKNLDETLAMSHANKEIGYRLDLACSLLAENSTLLRRLGVQSLAVRSDAELHTISMIKDSFDSGDRDRTKALLDSHEFERFAATKDEKDAYERVKGLVKLRRDRAKKIVREEVRDVFFAQSYDTYADEIAHVAPFAKTLETLVTRFSEVYSRLKQTENFIDFNDMEHMALRILENESIADDYRRRISHIFIDEYQDSNRVQDELIKRVARDNNVFMVGDVKQLIYSWRNAVPEIFLEKQERYRNEGGESSPDVCIDLSKNYRSKAGVIGPVNAVFETIMESHYSGMEYDEAARLEVGTEYDPEAEGKTFLHVIKKDKEHFDSDEAGEAALCAAVISGTIGREFYDTRQKVWRPVRYSDIVILLRSMKKPAEIYRKTLEDHDIPAACDRGEGYYETTEIVTFLALLRAIVNLRRDVPLAASMCSDVFGFGLSELADIRTEKKDGYFYTSFLAYAESGSKESLRNKCLDMASRLARWRDEERFMKLDDFLWKLMRESAYYDFAGKKNRGSARQANLRALLDKAAGFQMGRTCGLREFLGYIDRITAAGERQMTPPVVGDDVCRIMSIHRSKGLEFPIVLLGSMGKLFSAAGRSDGDLLLDREAGLSLKWRDVEMHTYKNTLFHSALDLREDLAERAESIRLLYVAMTRAMDTLHMIGTTSDPEKLLELYGHEEMKPKLDTDIYGATNYLKLILPAVMKKRALFGVVDHEALYQPQDALDFGVGSVGHDSLDGPVEFLKEDPSEVEIPETQMAHLENVIPQSPQDTEHLAATEGAYVYPYAASAKLKSKYSVTELSRPNVVTASKTEGRSLLSCGSQQDRGTVPAVLAHGPTFYMAGSHGESVEDAGLSAAEKGTALHRALELMDFKEACANKDKPEWFLSFLSGLAATGALSDAEAESVGADTLQRFAGSDVCARAASSPFLMKEAPFNMKHIYEGEEIIVQGVIDLLFEEGDGIVIVDYKSGWFDADAYEIEADRIQQTYGAQIKFYRRAAELIFEKPVTESLIYMTRTGLTV